MRICSNCRSEIAPDDVFCTGCGARNPPSEDQVSLERAAGYAAADGFSAPATATVGTAFQATTERASAYDAPGAQAARRPNSAAAPSGVLAPGVAPTRAHETLEQRYMRQTRNATVFIAVIVGIVTVIALVGVIWTSTTIARINSELNGVNGLSNCQSEGGTNPDC
jgi:cobalamin biosynthesis Mg chelatase CobN